MREQDERIADNTITLAVVDGQGDSAIRCGKSDFGQDNTSGFILGIDDSDNNTPKFEIGKDASNMLKLGSTMSYRGTLNADDLVAGQIRGINVSAASHMTKGTYLTASCGAGDSTLNVKDTTDFPSSGAGWIIDSANDRDAISWTGKTGTTLTGVTGVLAHTVSSTNVPVVVPAIKAAVISDAVNEMRFFGDRGDGTVEEILALGRIVGGGSYQANVQTGSLLSTNRAIWAMGLENAVLIESAVSDGSVAALHINTGNGSYTGKAIKANGTIEMASHEHNAMPTGGYCAFTIAHNSAWTPEHRLCYCSNDGIWRRVDDNSIVS